MQSPSRLVALDGIHNVRDLGGYARADGTETAWGRVYRACAQHRLSEQGVEKLHALGVATVVDLRSDAERQVMPSPFLDSSEASIVWVPLFDGLAPPTAMFETAPDLDLADRYIVALSECGANFRTVLTAIAEAPDAPLLFHCTAGKDRTGLIAALILSLAGVAAETIADDYGLTATLGKPLIDDLNARALERGSNPRTLAKFMASEPASMARVLAHLEASHGGARGYLAGTGMDDEALDRIGARLSAGAAAPVARLAETAP